MKRLKKLLYTTFFGATFALAILFPQKASAAATCYLFYAGQDRYEAISCSDNTYGSQITAAANAYFPGDNGLKDGQCYLLVVGTIAIEKAASGSSKCNQWAEKSTQNTNGSPPRCQVFKGSLEEYDGGEFPSSQFEDLTANRTCSSTQVASIRENFGEPQNDMCYVFFPNDDTRDDPIRRINCTVLFSYILNANANHLEATTNAQQVASGGTWSFGETESSGHFCGGDDSTTETRINIGCKGKGNAIVDMTFAIIRFLSIGVGIVMVGSLVVAGIQYTASRGDPNNTAAAINRIQNTLIAFIFYLFTYAILNYLIPAGLFGL